MKYVIRKIPERDTSYLEALIPGAEIYNDVNHEGCIKSFVGAMKMAEDDAVYIQDDMILCNDFKRKCDEICKAHKNEVVQLTNNTFYSEKTRILVGGYYHPKQVPWCLCVYIPRRLSSLFVKMYEDGTIKPSKYEMDGQSDDLLFAKFMAYMNEDEYLVVPNLAGHPLNKSYVNSDRDSQNRLQMNFEYDKAIARGNMDLEITTYLKHKSKYDAYRKKQEAERCGT